MPGYVIYIDTLILRLLANFFFEFILLWATAEVTRISTTRLRLACASLIGTVHYLLFMLSSYRIIPFYGLLRFFPIVLIVSVIMVLIAFHPFRRKQLLQVLAYFYGIGFISAGAGLAAAYFFGSVTNPQSTVGTLVAIAVILLIGELGWGIVQKRIYHHLYQLPILISFNQQSVCLTALIDTGNKLRDPLTNQSVIVVEKAAVMTLFDQETARLIDDLSSGNLDALTNHSDPQVATRLRLIPFSTIGKEKGLLVGFRPDRIEVNDRQEKYQLNKVVLAIYEKPLDPDGEYQALLPPELLHPNSVVPFPRSIRGGEPTHATNTQSEH